MIGMSVQTMLQAAILLLASTLGFTAVEEGESVPVFTTQTDNGRAFNSEKQLSGKSAVIAFWRLNQMFVDPLLADLQTLYVEYRGEDIEIVAICSGESTTGEVSGIVKRLGLEFDVLLDQDRAIYGDFGVFVIPSVAFVDEEGRLESYYASYRPDFLHVARANARFLLGRISEAQRDELIRPKESPEESVFNPAEPRFNLGMQYLSEGNRSAAMRELATAWKNEAFLVPAGTELGFLCLAEGKGEKALAYFNRVLEKDPDNLRAMGGMGIAYLKAGKAEAGKELVDKAVNAGLRDPLVFRELGVWWEEQGAYDEAMVSFREGLDAALEVP